MRGEPRHSMDTTRFAPSMLGQQVGGDAVEPRARGGPQQVVRRALLERDSEHFAHHALGLIRTEATHEVAMQHGRVPVEDRSERRGGNE